MKVYALVGPSGSGKSHRARVLSHEYGISLIIDDGLLIWNGRILAGKTAKKEKTKVGAIKTALFYEDKLVEETKKGIEYSGENEILILGTSIGMVKFIAKRLDLGEIDEIINIENIASEQEISAAKNVRAKEGKHVIPVPEIEVQSLFPGHIIDVLEMFSSRFSEKEKKESSIVRPKFSFDGELIIYDKVIVKTIEYYLENNFSEITEINNVDVEKKKFGLDISLELTLKYGVIIPDYIAEMKESLTDKLENFTGVKIQDISVSIVSLAVDL
ncbi:MAG: Asp23/Gls24 family envelope stress response protein [Bacillota bacterium]